MQDMMDHMSSPRSVLNWNFQNLKLICHPTQRIPERGHRSRRSERNVLHAVSRGVASYATGIHHHIVPEGAQQNDSIVAVLLVRLIIEARCPLSL